MLESLGWILRRLTTMSTPSIPPIDQFTTSSVYSFTLFSSLLFSFFFTFFFAWSVWSMYIISFC
ncbi:hypothetical protein BJX61DRAFT_497988 [Aspergillus egyptiacus]|nr:hypothetical protein BJX61DRAFT_497988 [Aspergillus egyptiacus]